MQKSFCLSLFVSVKTWRPAGQQKINVSAESENSWGLICQPPALPLARPLSFVRIARKCVSSPARALLTMSVCLADICPSQQYLIHLLFCFSLDVCSVVRWLQCITDRSLLGVQVCFFLHWAVCSVEMVTKRKSVTVTMEQKLQASYV